MCRSRGAHAAAAAALAALLVCTAALPHREQEALSNSADHSADSRLDGNGHKVRTLDALGGGNLVRDVREARRTDYGSPFHTNRHFEYLGPYGGKRELLRPAYRYIVGLYGDNDVPKRNFDEIDRTGFNNDRFMKRNFDEIDSTGLSADRFYKRNFDEIDHTGFGTFLKRSPPGSGERDSAPSAAAADLYPLPPYALRFYDRDFY